MYVCGLSLAVIIEAFERVSQLLNQSVPCRVQNCNGSRANLKLLKEADTGARTWLNIDELLFMCNLTTLPPLHISTTLLDILLTPLNSDKSDQLC